MYLNFDKHGQNLKNEEAERKDDISKATARKDDIQKQIDGINAYNKNLVDTNLKKGQEDLNSEAYLNL